MNLKVNFAIIPLKFTKSKKSSLRVSATNEAIYFLCGLSQKFAYAHFFAMTEDYLPPSPLRKGGGNFSIQRESNCNHNRSNGGKCFALFLYKTSEIGLWRPSSAVLCRNKANDYPRTNCP